MPLIEAPEQAMRLARAICSDVSLYNEEKIVRGIEQDNFFDALREELEEGRELYRSASPPTSTHDQLLRPRHRRRHPAAQGTREVADLVGPACPPTEHAAAVVVRRGGGRPPRRAPCRALAPALSRARVQRLIDEGHVLVDGRAAKPVARGSAAASGSQVESRPPSRRGSWPRTSPLAVLHEDRRPARPRQGAGHGRPPGARHAALARW